MTRRIPLLLFCALAALAGLPRHAAAQGSTCVLVYQNGPWTSVGDPASRVISADGPLLVRCSGGEELRSDSAVIYQNINEVHLFGQVDYQDPTRALTSDRATYNSQTGRLYATGNVVFTDKNRGSTLRGPELEYFRAMAGRPETQAIAPGRPHLTVIPRSEGGRRRDPMEVDADRITSVGDRFMTAEGNVVIVSDQTRSTGNMAQYDSDAERMELTGNAAVDGEKYDLTADYIESILNDGAIQQVTARTNSKLVSERLTVTGPQLQLFFERDLLQRLISSHMAGENGGGRSVALSKGFRMEADSLEAISPDQELRQVIAIGTAQGESWDTVPAAPRRVVAVDSAGGDSAAVLAADSLRAAETARLASLSGRDPTVPPTGMTEKDVLLADTIIGYFRADSAAADSAAPDSVRPDSIRPDSVRPDSVRPDSVRLAQRDTAARDTADAELERLVAIGNARSLYRMRDDSVKAGQKRPGLNYLIGDNIDLTFVDGEVDVARVRGLKKGVYLDPAEPGQGTAADSTARTGRRTDEEVPAGAPPVLGRPAQQPQPARPTTPATTPPPATPTTEAPPPAKPQTPPADEGGSA
jgi:lipopolysaccharide export system protein LptA